MPRLKPSGHLLALALIASSQTVLGKFALERMPVFGYTALRFALAYLIIYMVLLTMRKSLPWNKVKLFAPVAILWIISGVTFIFGLQHTNATTSQFIHTSIPVITAIFAGVILKHRLSTTQWLGVAIAVAGIVLITLSQGSLSFSNANFLGSVLIFISGIGFAFYAVLTKLPRYRSITPSETVFIGFTFGVPMILPFAIAELAREGYWLPEVSLSAWIALVLASMTMVFFATFFQMLINKIGPSFASLNQYLIPVFVIFWALLLLDEKPDAQALAGASIALIGVGLVAWHQRKSDLETSVRASSSAE